MSPDLAFALTLALKMAVTAAFVVFATAAAERLGAMIGALIATLPISAGPAYVFLALDHDAAFIAASALGSLAINAATAFFALAYSLLAQRHGTLLSLSASLALWFALAIGIQTVTWTLALGVTANVLAYAICLPQSRRLTHVRMPPIRRRWYDVPLRAAGVAGLVAAVILASNHLGPRLTGAVALFPIVLTSLIVIFQPRIGGKATAALIANTIPGLIGFGLAVVTLHVAALALGSTAGLTLALMVSMSFNFAIFLARRRGLLT
jgi:hypothetical protein